PAACRGLSARRIQSPPSSSSGRAPPASPARPTRWNGYGGRRARAHLRRGDNRTPTIHAMDRRDVARGLEESAAMLELEGSNPFKIKAYENGAKAVLAFPGDLQSAVASGELKKVPGIGATLFGNVEALITTGSLPYYEELRSRFPPGLRECLRIPGLGARRVKQLHDELGIESVEMLEKACLEGRLTKVRGFGGKSAEKVLKGIGMLRQSSGLHLYRPARPPAREGPEA